MLRKIFILIITASGLMSCDRTANWTAIDFLSGTWEARDYELHQNSILPWSTNATLNGSFIESD
ncbi:hypothetical protein N9Y13_05325 [Schleiferiaceae bacterium]|nr:hypothetical protein [Schleiferiaceae bacterium]